MLFFVGLDYSLLWFNEIGAMNEALLIDWSVENFGVKNFLPAVFHSCCYNKSLKGL